MRSCLGGSAFLFRRLRNFEETSFMSRGPRQEQIGGAAQDPSDASVWSAIQYLDSPSDYREHLRAPAWMQLTLLMALGLMVLVLATCVAVLSGEFLLT